MNTELFRCAPPHADPREPWSASDFEARLRGMERFSDVQALVSQMGRDVGQARERLARPAGRA